MKRFLIEFRESASLALSSIAAHKLRSGLTLLGVLIGEMFASQRGLGFLLMNAIGLNDGRTIMAITLMIAVVAVLANAALLTLDRRLHR